MTGVAGLVAQLRSAWAEAREQAERGELGAVQAALAEADAALDALAGQAEHLTPELLQRLGEEATQHRLGLEQRLAELSKEYVTVAQQQIGVTAARRSVDRVQTAARHFDDRG